MIKTTAMLLEELKGYGSLELKLARMNKDGDLIFQKIDTGVTEHAGTVLSVTVVIKHFCNSYDQKLNYQIRA